MLIKVTVQNAEVLSQQDNGTLVLRLKYYAAHAIALHLATVKGSTLEDFERNKCCGNKQVFVGQRGGITVE